MNMIASTSLLALTLLLATVINGSSVRSRLTTRSVEPDDNGVERHTVFEKTSQQYTQSLSVITASCANGDTVTVEQSITTLQTSIESVNQVVQSEDFDEATAVTHKENVVAIIVSYSRIVTTLVSHPKVEHGCESKIQQINTHVQTVINAYISLGIDVEQDVKSAGGIDERAFASMKLQLNFSSQSDSDFSEELETADNK